MPIDTDTFSKWLNEQEDIKRWTDYRLATVAKLSPSVISRARSGTMPKWEACVALATALNVSPVTAFRKAGLLPDVSPEQTHLEDWTYLLSQLTPEDEQELREIATRKIERRQEVSVYQQTRKTRVIHEDKETK